MLNKKMWLVLLSILIISVLVSACGGKTEQVQNGNSDNSEKKFLSLGTSSVGGAWNIIGATISDLVKEEYPNIKITAEVTGGASDNMKLIGTKKVQLSMVTSDIAYNAYNGLGDFSDKPIKHIKAMLGGDMLVAQVYTLEKNGINSIGDLKGKKISIGAIGSVANGIMTEIMKSYGLEIKKDWTPEYLGHQEGADALVDGHVDAVIYVGTLGAPAPSAVSMTHEVKFIEIDNEHITSLLKQHPYWVKAQIPPDTYNNQKQTVATIGVPTILLVDETVNEKTVYNITKVILENTDRLAKAHPSGEEWSKENIKRGIEGVIPYHSGAEKYFKEAGLL
ncbi:TAXI family TRAP transporter solute-binding subunit [Desulfallas sp. Bu1-1]|uniref:TAXI family TRAP transporter solute-binding subunit n=1 Tax=Desulfallas sp. Bu1-1 TaxID=2787620 RepID=UPI00189E2C49|nr:TAXI family TRAP transporter solute-binding subunit [Desulfallas sp. Bu1-1]MBF7084527.1 TAXI family TRAP transporter solute-binding subunit [Desulfallas sp. Bu1-1]